MGKPNNEILKPDTKIEDACRDLMEHAHNQGTRLVLVGPTFKENPKGTIYTSKVDGVEIGYRRTAYATFMRREIFFKVPGYSIDDLHKEEYSRAITAILNVFGIPGASPLRRKRIAVDCERWVQDFIPMIPVEKSPGLVSIAGGFNA